MKQRLHTREPVAEAAVQVVCQVDTHQDTCGRGVDGHVVGGVIEELGTAVPLNVVGIVIAPAQLHIDPVLSGGGAVEAVLGFCKERGFGDGPLVGGEEKHIRARGVHLVGLPRVDRLFLHHLDLQSVQLQIEDLTQVHDDTLVDLLPQVRPEDLDEGNLQGRNLPVHENAREVQLHLETHVHVGAVDRRRPPQGEAPVRNLVETTPLRICQLLEAHGLLKAARLLPEETLPCREVGALEEGVLQDSFDAAQGLDHVGTVVVQVPELPIMALVRPPEGVLPHDVVLLEVLAHTPTSVEGERVAVLLEERVDAWDTTIPSILQILQREAPVLGVCLLALQGVLRPDALAVDELSLPGLDVPVKIRDELILLMAQPAAVVGDARLGLLRVPQVRLRDKDVAHTQHAKAAQLLRSVEDHGREARGHLGVQPDLDAGLHLVLALHEEI
mmetsp:Transcript_59082/g.126986  ORF Transcript_59082/g.126986 Transcript_59082/m.126986 type:complete len:443 (-) Transcript_59082:1525-2853(-)